MRRLDGRGADAERGDGLLVASSDDHHVDAMAAETGEKRADLVVVQLAWGLTEPADAADEPNALLHSRVFLNSREIERAVGVTVRAKGGDFAEVDVHLAPTSIRFVAANKEQFADPSALVAGET